MAIVRLNVMLPVPIEFVALALTLNVPVAPGEPEINPVAALIDKPPGRPEALKLVGKLLAVI